MIQQIVATVTSAVVLACTPVFAVGDEDGGGSAVPVSGDGASQLAQLDGAVRDYLAENDFPGATVAVTKGSRLVWAKGYGYADTSTGTLMQPETRMKIGSTSKMLTAIGALGLVEDGALDLDQHVYGSGASPLWGSDPGATPGVVSAADGVLEDPHAYFEAMVAGVDALGQYFPPAEHLDELPSLNWALLTQAAYEQEITTTLDRASQVRVKDLLSHTAGFRRGSGDAKQAAAEHFETTEDELTEEQLHHGVLMGMAGGAPFVLDPGTEWEYSNVGFAFAGQIVGAASDEGDYRQYIENQLLAPLGLFDVVPNNASISELDALPHDADNEPLPLDPDSVSRLLLATGGWSASARDLARVMCSIDATSNNLRSLEPSTVEMMMSDAAPDAAGLNPLGWDKYSESKRELTKNGDLPGGGSSRISKFLPGAFAQDPDTEINVAVAINRGDSVPSEQLLRDIAELVAQANIPADYDLFDPASACLVEESLPVGAAPPTSTPTADPARDSGPPSSVDPSRIPQPPTPNRPVITDLRIEPGELWEQRHGGTSCGEPDRAAASASVSSPAGIHSVELGWQIGGHERAPTVPMTGDRSGRWSGELEPSGPDSVPTGRSLPVTVTITATDNAGRSTTVETTVTVHDCAQDRPR